MRKTTVLCILLLIISSSFGVVGILPQPEGAQGPPGPTIWQQNGNDIYYNDGNVGIGTSTPGANLEVFSNSTIASVDIITEDNTTYAILQLQHDNQYGPSDNTLTLAALGDNTGIGMMYGVNADNMSLIQASDGDSLVVATSDGYPLIFGTDSLERALIEDDGDFIIYPTGDTDDYFVFTSDGSTPKMSSVGSDMVLDVPTGESGYMTVNGGTQASWDANNFILWYGNDLIIYSDDIASYAEIYQDNSRTYFSNTEGDMYFVATGGDIQARTGTDVMVWDPTNSEYGEILHDGNDMRIVTGGGGDIELSPYSNRVGVNIATPSCALQVADDTGTIGVKKLIGDFSLEDVGTGINHLYFYGDINNNYIETQGSEDLNLGTGTVPSAINIDGASGNITTISNVTFENLVGGVGRFRIDRSDDGIKAWDFEVGSSGSLNVVPTTNLQPINLYSARAGRKLELNYNHIASDTTSTFYMEVPKYFDVWTKDGDFGLRVVDSGYTDLIGLYHDDDDGVIWTNTGDIILSPDSDNVGIGISNPDSPLNVEETDTTRTSATLKVGRDTGGPTFTSGWDDDVLHLRGPLHTNLIIEADTTSDSNIMFGDADDLDVGKLRYLHSSDRLDFIVNAGTRASIDSDGDFGIGTTNPDAELDVEGMIRAEGFSPTYPSTGIGLELFYNTGDSSSKIQSYDRGSSAWKDMDINALGVDFNVQNSIEATINGDYVLYIGQNEIGYEGNINPSVTNSFDLGTDSLNWREINYHALDDNTCADFSSYTSEELYNIFKQFQPRNDGSLHHSPSADYYWPHINMSSVPDEFATRSDEDIVIEGLYRSTNYALEGGKRSYTKKDNFELVNISYKAGEKKGIDFGTMTYALKDWVVKIYEDLVGVENNVGINTDAISNQGDLNEYYLNKIQNLTQRIEELERLLNEK